MNPLLATGVLDLGRSLITRFFPDPEQKAKAELELLQMQSNGELKALEARFSAITAEAQSEDKWTSRARPSFMYVFYFVILSMVVVAPIIGVFFPEQMAAFFSNVATGFEAIPEEMWWVFTAGYLGYTGVRTIEKRGKVPK